MRHAKQHKTWLNTGKKTINRNQLLEKPGDQTNYTSTLNHLFKYVKRAKGNHVKTNEGKYDSNVSSNR